MSDDSGSGWGGSWSSGPDSARSTTTYAQDNSGGGDSSLSSQYASYGSGRSSTESSSGYGVGANGYTDTAGTLVNNNYTGSGGANLDESNRIQAAWNSEKPVAYNQDGSFNWAYDAKNPGWREKLNDLTTPAKGSLLDRLGVRGLGMSQDQFLAQETTGQRADRMGLAGDLILKAATAPMGPIAGLAINAGRAVRDMNVNNVPASKAFGGLVPGLINGALNGVTGGLVGKVGQLSSISGALGGPTAPNIGAKIYEAAGGGYNNAAKNPVTGGEYFYPDGNPITSSGGGSSSGSQQPAPVAAPVAATPERPDDLDASLYNIDGAGWTTAKSKYMNARKAGGY
jgi:hypothetical protein